MKYKISNFLLVLFYTCLFFPALSLANSSWHWLTDARPIYILPIACVATIAIETIMILKCAKIKNSPKVLTCVLLANLLSFAVPYILMFCFGTPYDFKGMIENTPSYTICASYLVMTLLAEIPVVYFMLKNDTDNKLKLVCIIILCNAITTLLVTIMERSVCVGSW